ncbi:unnamed protein product [Prorocentrum cordatum]|uniref:Uncharacterized protein n=1 Tax=Prorocentrum cordatum TaxID=2364126 RepID=A0ABN9X2J6_9DINO|nr:unnamed protein product [Polarella glacialis]
MVVAARLRWVRRRLEANADVRIVIGSAQHAARSKIKILVGEVAQPSHLHKVMQSAVLSAIEELCSLHHAVDRGHLHTDGTSEIAIWVTAGGTVRLAMATIVEMGTVLVTKILVVETVMPVAAEGLTLGMGAQIRGDSTFRPYDGPIIGSDCVQYGWPLGDFINRFCVIVEGEFLGRVGLIHDVTENEFMIKLHYDETFMVFLARAVHECRDPSSTRVWEAMLLEKTVNGELPAGSASAVVAERYLVIWRDPGPRPGHEQLFELLLELAALAAGDPWTHVAVTNNFQGSPHRDEQDATCWQRVISLGDFVGGELCVEGPLEGHDGPLRRLYVVSTRNRLTRVDGRFPHFVRQREGDRFSLVYYCLDAGEFREPTRPLELPGDAAAGPD